jgi:hypothetical protein
MSIRWLPAQALHLLLAVNLAQVAQAATPTTQSLYDRISPAVVEVTVENRSNLGRVSSASGFVTHRRDWVVTNYHAIDQAIFAPDVHRLQVKTTQRNDNEIKVLAVDVVNDLAILQIERKLDAPLLELRETLPAKGESGYSMGKPGSYQHSIVGGTFNGTIDKNTAALIVFSGAINAGMSGGPTLDAQGRVVGVNVASSTRHQLVGLAVPAEAVGQLIRRSSAQTPPSIEALRADIARQFGEYGRQILGRLDLPTHSVRRLGPFRLRGDLNQERPCGTSTEHQPEDQFERLRQYCSLGDGLFVMDGQRAGSIINGAFWTHSNTLSPIGLAKLVENQLGSLRSVNDEDSPPGRWHCTEQRLRVTFDLPVQLHACRRAVQHLPGLFDYRFRYVPLTDGQDALVGAVGLSGFDDETARGVLAKVLQTLRYTPDRSKTSTPKARQ